MGDEARALRRAIHRAIERVTFDLSDRCQPNTAIAAQMELLNALAGFGATSEHDRAVLREGVEVLLHLLSPFAPHLADELWSEIGGEGLLLHRRWPEVDASALAEAMIEVPVQVNGKVRGRVRIAADAGEAQVIEAARAAPRIQELLVGKRLARVAYIPRKIVTLVVE